MLGQLEKQIEKSLSQLSKTALVRACVIRLPGCSLRRRKLHQLSRKYSQELLKKLTQAAPTSFGHYFVSVSHTQKLLVVVGLFTSHNHEMILGVGLDVEQERLISKRLFRRFANPGERRVAHGAGWSPLQLWTLKEAALKANPQNKGTFPIVYRLKSVAKEKEARLQWRRASFIAFSKIRKDIVFAVALCRHQS